MGLPWGPNCSNRCRAPFKLAELYSSKLRLIGLHKSKLDKNTIRGHETLKKASVEALYPSIFILMSMWW